MSYNLTETGRDLIFLEDCDSHRFQWGFHVVKALQAQFLLLQEVFQRRAEFLTNSNGKSTSCNRDQVASALPI